MIRKKNTRHCKSSILFVVSMISIASFCVGKSYDQIRSKLTKKITPTDTALRSNQNACQVEKINKIPENSYIIIGHAYGSHEGSAQRNHEGIAPSIKTLIKYNKSRISGIIFTGDVLSVPSEKKWRDLHQLTQPIPVYIAPGNHDVSIIQDSASRDIFNKRSTAQSLIYPQSIMIDEALFIIDDSNPRNSSEKLGSYIVSEIKKRPSISNAIVVRHHVLPEELRYAQNGESPSKYWSANEFSIIRQQLPESTELSFIYGDGGAFTRLPRMSCTSISGFKNIVNGIGELKDDRILIYNEGKLSYYVLGRTGF